MIRFFIIQFAIFRLMVNAQAGDQLSGKVAVAPTQKIELFDGQSFSGWVFVSKDTSAPADAIWSVVDGVIVCQGKPNGYARTVQAYRDYQLHVEWRFQVGPGNSGVFLHINAPDKVWPSCLEVQLLSDKAGDIRCNGGSLVQELTADFPKTVPHRQPSSEKPVGEWNTCDIVCRGNRVMIRVNGVLQNEVTGSSVASGAVGLQSEGKPVEFRNVFIEPLP
jgi:hypothetical protein